MRSVWPDGTHSPARLMGQMITHLQNTYHEQLTRIQREVDSKYQEELAVQVERSSPFHLP